MRETKRKRESDGWPYDVNGWKWKSMKSDLCSNKMGMKWTSSTVCQSKDWLKRHHDHFSYKYRMLYLGPNTHQHEQLYVQEKIKIIGAETENWLNSGTKRYYQGSRNATAGAKYWARNSSTTKFEIASQHDIEYDSNFPVCVRFSLNWMQQSGL